MHTKTAIKISRKHHNTHQQAKECNFHQEDKLRYYISEPVRDKTRTCIEIIQVAFTGKTTETRVHGTVDRIMSNSHNQTNDLKNNG